jgi:hypothetical protein
MSLVGVVFGIWLFRAGFTFLGCVAPSGFNRLPPWCGSLGGGILLVAVVARAMASWFGVRSFRLTCVAPVTIKEIQFRRKN